MASNIKVGDKVRINQKYSRILGGIKENEIGLEFIVTRVRRGVKPVSHESDQVISGDPNDWGIWGDFLDVVQAGEDKRIAKIQKTTDAIRSLGNAFDRLRQRADISPRAHSQLTNLLDEITEAMQEERA